MQRLLKSPSVEDVEVTLVRRRPSDPIASNIVERTPQVIPPAEAPPLPPEEPLRPEIDFEAERERLRLEITAGLEDQARKRYAQAVTDGLEQGRNEARAEAEGLLEQLHRALDEVEERRAMALEAAADDIVAAVLSAVCKIAGEALCTHGGARAVVAEVIRRVRTPILRISVAPADYDVIAGMGGAPANSVVVADDRVELGGCLVEYQGGGLDGRLETQLEELKEVLLSWRRTQSSAEAADL